MHSTRSESIETLAYGCYDSRRVMTDESKPYALLRNQFEGCVSTGGSPCECLKRHRSPTHRAAMRLHTGLQDETRDAWRRLTALVEEAAADGRRVFAPAQELGTAAWGEILTLPPTIAKLKRVKQLQLYGSNLVRIPPEVGEMESLEQFTPYTSYGLHWFPYEITRCEGLRDSTVSTRAIYGNYKTKLSFPRLPCDAGTLGPENCSVCRGAFGPPGPLQRWVSLRVATDVLPLLVHACSDECIERIPSAPEGYAARPHCG